MFTIYMYSVGGRRFDRYFRSWDNAKTLLEEEKENLLKSGWTQKSHVDKMNLEKGFYIYEYALLTPEGEEASLALIDGFFMD